MDDTIVSARRVALFGRPFASLTLVKGQDPTGSGGSTTLEKQINHDDARLARIYAYAYEGQHTLLRFPAIFLVHGAGEDAATAVTSLLIKPEKFESDVKVWYADRRDITLRLDLESGTFAEVLMGPETADGGLTPGMNVGMRVGMRVGMNVGMRVGQGGNGG